MRQMESRKEANYVTSIHKVLTPVSRFAVRLFLVFYNELQLIKKFSIGVVTYLDMNRHYGIFLKYDSRDKSQDCKAWLVG